MSLEIIKKKHLVLKENIYTVPNDDFFNLSRAIIPISDFFQKSPRLDVYTGMESIPFADRDPEYKNTLLSEFL
jgi:hypothetical protein